MYLNGMPKTVNPTSGYTTALKEACSMCHIRPLAPRSDGAPHKPFDCVCHGAGFEAYSDNRTVQDTSTN